MQRFFLKQNTMAKQNKFLFLFSCFFISTLYGQSVIGTADSILIWKEQFGSNKEVPESLEIPFYMALSHYPELADKKIKVKFQRIKTTMNARPNLKSILFKRRSKYEFILRINNTKKDSVIYYDDIPENAKVGILGHEFAHFTDYLEGKSGHIILRALNYLNPKKKRAYEKETDLETIHRGLGEELYLWSWFVQHDSNATAKYKLFKRTVYLSPEEIRNVILTISKP